MVKIEKEMVITIDGDDAKIFTDVCKLARRMCGHGSVEIEYGKRFWEIKNFLDYIFDNT